MPVIARGVQNLQRFQRQLDAAARGAIADAAAKKVGATLLKLVADEFRQSVDPYLRPWAPVVRNRRRDRSARNRRIARGQAVRADKPLVDTGRLRGSAGISVSGAQVRVFLTANYASYHQWGTRHIKQRMILPGDGPLPLKWRDAIDKDARATLRDHFKGS